MIIKYMFLAFALAGVHAKDEGQHRRIRQQRYAKSSKASKRLCQILYCIDDKIACNINILMHV